MTGNKKTVVCKKVNDDTKKIDDGYTGQFHSALSGCGAMSTNQEA